MESLIDWDAYEKLMKTRFEGDEAKEKGAEEINFEEANGNNARL